MEVLLLDCYLSEYFLYRNNQAFSAIVAVLRIVTNLFLEELIQKQNISKTKTIKQQQK